MKILQTYHFLIYKRLLLVYNVCMKGRDLKLKSFLPLFCISQCFVVFLAQAAPMPLSPYYYPISEDLVCGLQAKEICHKLNLKPGDPVDPEKALSLAQKSKNVDLSLLNPEESHLWKNKREQTPHDQNFVKDRNFVFLGVSPTHRGFFRFLVKGVESGKRYRLVLGRNAHNILLRKALFEKLGYKTPPFSHIKKLSVQFQNSNEWNSFLKQMNRNMGIMSLTRWVTNIEKKDKESNHWDLTDDRNRLHLQDVLITSESNAFYDLPMAIHHSIIQNRRVLRSLLIPYSLVEIPESLNKWPWNMGKKINNQIFFFSEFEDQFHMGYEDGKWISRRILKLSRKDFEDIAQKGAFPRPVELLVVEKLISRRNSLCRIFFSRKKSCFMDVNIKVDDPQNPHLLKDGVLLKDTKNGNPQDEEKWWSGYASRFSYGADESPFSRNEVMAFFKSQIFSNFLSNFMVEINDDIMPNSQDELRDEAEKEYKKDFLKEVERDLKKGKKPNNRVKSFNVWDKTFFNFQLIASRDILFGSYQGTDNDIQLAQSFGWAMDPGLFLGSHGLGRDIILSATSGLSYAENYVHISPTLSIEEARKTPYRNIFVNFIMKEIGSQLKSVYVDEKDLSLETRDKQKEVLEQMSAVLEENLKVGESFIITRSIGPYAALRSYLLISHEASIGASLRKQIVEVERVHIFRKNQQEVQVYVSHGNNSSWSFSFQLRYFIPILTYSHRTLKSVKPVETKFFKMNMNLNPDKNPKIFDNFFTLQSLFKNPMKNEFLFDPNSDRDYITIAHNFIEKASRLRFLWLDHLRLNQFDKIKVTEKSYGENFERNYIRASEGIRTGSDYQNVTFDVLNYFIEDWIGSDTIQLGVSNTGRPSETLFGKSQSQEISFEGIVEDSHIKDIFLKNRYTWKGWSMSKEKAEELFKKINDFQSSMKEKTNLEALPISTLNATEKLQLYSIYYDIYVYETGLYNLSLWGENDSEKILDFFRSKGFPYEHFHCPTPSHSEVELTVFDRCGPSLVRLFLSAQKNYRAFTKSGQHKKAAKAAFVMIKLISSFKFSDFVEAVGGIENVYARSFVLGYRDGDEGNHSPIYGNTAGEVGSQKGYGPLQHTRDRLGLSESEFYIYWLMRKL